MPYLIFVLKFNYINRIMKKTFKNYDFKAYLLLIISILLFLLSISYFAYCLISDYNRKNLPSITESKLIITNTDTSNNINYAVINKSLSQHSTSKKIQLSDNNAILILKH